MVGANRTMLGQYAGFITRASAMVIDIVIVSVVVILINWMISLPFTYFLGLDLSVFCSDESISVGGYAVVMCRTINIIYFVVTLITAPIYFTLFISIGGQTVGKYVMGVRVVRIDGQPMNIGIAFFRWLGYFVSAVLLMLGFLLVIVSDRRRALHDRLAGTCVIYAWRARQDEFQLEKVYRWFNKGESQTEKRLLPKLSSAYDIVAIALPNYRRMQMTLNALDSVVDRGEVVVVNTAVLAKDSHGDLGVVGVSDLAVGSDQLSMIDATLNIPHAQMRQIEDDMPADSFIVVVLLRDEYVDALTGQISRRAAAHVRVYDVGEHPETLTSPDGQSLKKAAITPEPEPEPEPAS